MQKLHDTIYGFRLLATVLTVCISTFFITTVNAQDDQAAAAIRESSFFIPPGFTAAGETRTASGPGTGTLQITVRDHDTGELCPCRMNVIGVDGNFYQPADNPLSMYSLTGQWPSPGAKGNRKEKGPWRYLGRFFYSTGEINVTAPAGQVRIEVFRGFEFRPEVRTVVLEADKVLEVELDLTRTAPMPKHGYFGGDPHLHLPRTSDSDDETLFALLAAEDIAFGTPLGYNEPAGPYSGFMEKMDYPQFRGLGLASIRRRNGYQILSGQEYRSSQYGHLNLYLRDRLVHEGESFNADDWPVYGMVGAETQTQGGYAIHAHGGYGLEIYADAALGTVNAVELLQFGIYRGIGLQDWYHMLNTGYRFPCVGASDYPACRFLGDCRTYVRPVPDEADTSKAEADSTAASGSASVEAAGPDFPAWLRAASEGRSFVTTGPLLLLDVDGHHPGDTVSVDVPESDPQGLTAHIRMRCEVTTVQQVDLIVNGTVRKTIPLGSLSPDAEGWYDVKETLEMDSSGWIAARAYSVNSSGLPDAESHTNPIYYYRNGKKPYLQESLDQWVRRIDVQVEKHSRRSFEQKAQVLDYFQKARDRLLSIREKGGLKADEDPSQFQELFPDADAASLEKDPSRADVTDEELREFLKPVPAKSPEEAVRAFEGVEGFRMQTVAAEPMVHSPVAAAFDEDGNLFVCEMTDYPYKPAEGHDPIGTLRILRDKDGDGVFDEAHVFADKVLWAAGVVPWKGGVFVAASPDILYLKDTDGDFKADIRRVVFTGFGTGNQQAMVNNLQFGLDHWIYGTTAGNGGLIRPGDQPDAPGIPVNGRDFRFDPITEKFELVTGTVQFGNSFDNWGNRFTCSQSQPLIQVVLPDHYLARNPYLPTPSGTQDISPGPVPIYRISPIERWRQIRSSRRIAKNERAATSSGASHHVIDAAAGATIYRGGAYPPEFVGQAFVGDGQNNLIHRMRLKPKGVLYSAERVDSETEFMRSPDIWFRPVNFVNAPDGTLYCCDMNREVLESIHIPLDVVRFLDLKSGRYNGRIYRIAPPGFVSPKPPHLSSASSAELLAALESPHGWWRETAHRLLFEKQDHSITPQLIVLAEQHPRPETRLQAAWLLHGLKMLTADTCLKLLKDSHPGVRENGVRLAESLLRALPDAGQKIPEEARPKLVTAVCQMADDSEPRVRFQTAFTLGEISESSGWAAEPAAQATMALLKIAQRDGEDQWIRTAVLSSSVSRAESLFVGLLALPNRSAAVTSVQHQLASLIGARGLPEEVARTLDQIAASSLASDQTAVDTILRELGNGLSRSGAQLTLASESSPGRQLLINAMQRAAAAAADSGATDALRVDAIRLLGCQRTSDHRILLSKLLSVEHPPAVQITAAKVLADDQDASAIAMLLSSWSTYLPETRLAALNGLLSGEPGTLALLEAASRSELTVADIEPTRREVLLTSRNEKIRRLAESVFGSRETQPRRSVVDAWKPALTLKGDPAAGQKIFEKTCSACHRLGGIGHSIGPNLASSPSRDPSALLNNILDPNQFVLPAYQQYVVIDRSGRTFTGLLSSQSATSITLKKEKAETITILRGDVEEMISSNRSLMPEGLEKELTPQSLADLMAWIAGASTMTPENPNAERDFGTLPGLIETGPVR